MADKKKILIVDDEAIICESLGEFLERRGYEVTLAKNGEQALASIKAAFFPVVVLDLKIPDIDGEVVLKEIIKLYPDSKVIIVTGFTEGTSREELVAKGAHDCMFKPIGIKDMFEKIEKLY